MTVLEEHQLVELIQLVVEAEAKEMIDSMLVENSPSTRLISLKDIEIKLIIMKTEVQ